MTRKDYVKFAAMFKYQIHLANDYHYANERQATIDNVAKATADLFADDNPNFDRARFLTACGVNS